ncbi:MAG: hypothetical protein IKJ35_04600 [Clostridia bacterium]|nr:hypothetical protein [Clostridia bacterium]
MKKTLRILALSIVLVTLVAAFASCGGPAKDPADALAALKKNDYIAAEDKVILPLTFNAMNVQKVETVVSGTKVTEEGTEHITVVYFEDKAAANDAWEKIEKYAKENAKNESDWVVKKSGAMIYFGTAAGVKAAK